MKNNERNYYVIVCENNNDAYLLITRMKEIANIFGIVGIFDVKEALHAIYEEELPIEQYEYKCGWTTEDISKGKVSTFFEDNTVIILPNPRDF